MAVTNPPVKILVLVVSTLMAIGFFGVLRRRAASTQASWSESGLTSATLGADAARRVRADAANVKGVTGTRIARASIGREKSRTKAYGIVQLLPKARRKIWELASSLTIATKPPMPDSHGKWQDMIRASTFIQGLSPTTSCLQTRYGTLNDGGKTLCNANHFLSAPRCLIYSFGVQRTCTAEQEIHEDFPHCEILMFDPTSTEFFKKASCCRQSNMKCIETALGGGQDVADTLGMAGDTLTEIMRQHGHVTRKINLLKMDIEGSEYGALEYHMNNAQTASFPAVDLLLMEIHGLKTPAVRERAAKIIEWLENIGLSIYYVERNPRYPMTNAEIALVNRSMLVPI
ncbi:uncharacterized protein LOC135828767 [Sycon ciliatum]|uniref:uncharacterized protein LOC135828767 n=1 Tax=Sycon ciliatum TaxID=27933 RepID=UPI0020A9124A